MKMNRCPECEEPEFMCECQKNFQGKIVTEVYHRGVFIDAQQLRRQLFTLNHLPTVIIGRKAFTLKHVGESILQGVR